MKYLAAIGLFAVAILSMACGVSDDAKLSELEEGDAEDICSEVTAESKDCGNGVTVSRKAGADCTAGFKALPASCSATVGDFRACNEAPICDTAKNSSCAKIVQCALGGS